ncbi:MAG: PPC domain-containing protein [Pirellulales bacterium]
MLRTATAVVVLVIGLIASTAEAGSPRLLRVSPPGGQRGTTVEVQLVGRYLERPEELMFYEPGISVESLEKEPTEDADSRRERGGPATRVKVRLKLADDCPLGAHSIRLRTAQGVTDLQRFFVGPFPIVEEQESTRMRNDKTEAAMAVEMNTTVVGRMLDPTDIDLYRIQAKQGKRISVEIESARLGTDRGVPDLHLSVLDESGKPIQAADDSALFVQDPVISLVAPRDGVYFIAVRHSTYNAANESYRLHVGTFIRPTALYPAGGPAGQPLTVAVLGDPLGPTQQSVTLPTTGRDFGFSATSDDGPAPTPNLLRVSPFPNVLEAEPNDTPEAIAAQSAATVPAAFNGILEKPGDVDHFRFVAKKGDRFKVHCLANAFGAALDPTLTITPVDRKTGGGVQRGADSRPNQLGLPPIGGFQRESLDPVVDFTAPADGEYVIKVEDDRGQGGADCVYRVEVQPETDAVLTYVPLEPENQLTPQARQTINVAAGNRYNTSIAIFNTNRAFPGEMELVAVGLPEGVTMQAPKITTAMPRVPVVFEAADGAPLAGKFVDILVRPVGEKAPEPLASGFRQIVAMNSYGNNDFYLHTVVDRLAVAVTEPAPFSIEVDAPKSALVQNGEMPIKFRVIRHAGFEGPVTVSMEWRPNGVTGATPVLIKPDQTEGEYLLSAARNASPGTSFVTLTCVSGGERPGYNDSANRTYTASKPFSLTIAEPHVEAKFARTSVERGKTSQVVVKLNTLRPFPGTAKATLARLPRGVELVEPIREVKSDDKEVTFTIRATPDCLVGNYQGITLDLSVQEDGQTVRQLVGYGLLRVDTERGVAATK